MLKENQINVLFLGAIPARSSAMPDCWRSVLAGSARRFARGIAAVRPDIARRQNLRTANALVGVAHGRFLSETSGSPRSSASQSRNSCLLDRHSGESPRRVNLRFLLC